MYLLKDNHLQCEKLFDTTSDARAALLTFLTYDVSVVDVVEDHDVSLRIWVEISEGSGANLHVHQPPLEDVHEWQPSGRAEAGAAVVHDDVGPHVLGCDLVHTAAAHED